MLSCCEMWPFRRQKTAEPESSASDRPSDLHCSFCGKSQDEIRKLIAGPDEIYICDECVDLCNDIIAEECDQEEPEAGARSIPSLDPSAWCRACRLPKLADEVVAVPDVGWVCQRCIDLIRAVTDEPVPE
jgi:hypothetical protein